jgi:hypothetical protein
VTATARTLALAFCLAVFFLVVGCESDTSPAQGNNPPPPPSRTPTALRHGPNTFPMSNEMSEEEARKLLEGKQDEAGDDQGEDEAKAEETKAPEPDAE